MTRKASPPRLFALLGDPVGHSLSPAIHAAAFEAVGLDAIYTSLNVQPDEVTPVMRALARNGGGGNVTLPHKGRAATALDYPSPAVKATGACNVFYWENGLGGDNTDVAGFRAAAERFLGDRLAGARLLLLGAGGAARAALHACRLSSVDRVHVMNRTAANAERMIRELDAAEIARVVPGPTEPSASYDLVVNATSLGLESSDPLPLDPERVEAGALLDMVYAEGGTPLVRRARELGMEAEDGRRMLVEQAAAAFELWFHRDAPRRAMEEAAGLD